MSNAEAVWATHELSETKHSTWSVGALQLHAKSPGDEIWIANSYLADKTSDETPLEWSRWGLKKDINSLELVPSFPDKSVVVKPEAPFRLLPGVQARIFVRVPIWISVRLPGKDGRLLTEVPSVILSLTWFGAPTEGELCYWISSSARRDANPDPKRSHLILCPLQLKNTSDEDLVVQKLCLSVKWLSIYEHNGQLWSNETKVSFRGLDDISQVNVTSGPPNEAPKAKLKNAAREQFKKGSAIRTFFEF